MKLHQHFVILDTVDDDLAASTPGKYLSRCGVAAAARAIFD
jgi:hypothetical protein